MGVLAAAESSCGSAGRTSTLEACDAGGASLRMMLAVILLGVGVAGLFTPFSTPVTTFR